MAVDTAEPLIGQENAGFRPASQSFQVSLRVTVDQIFRWPVQIPGDARQILRRDPRDISHAAGPASPANKGNDDVISGKLNFGEEHAFCVHISLHGFLRELQQSPTYFFFAPNILKLVTVGLYEKC
jgi:hypothetical protein